MLAQGLCDDGHSGAPGDGMRVPPPADAPGDAAQLASRSKAPISASRWPGPVEAVGNRSSFQGRQVVASPVSTSAATGDIDVADQECRTFRSLSTIMPWHSVSVAPRRSSSSAGQRALGSVPDTRSGAVARWPCNSPSTSAPSYRVCSATNANAAASGSYHVIDTSGRLHHKCIARRVMDNHGTRPRTGQGSLQPGGPS